jgi:hypothetical protein
MSATEAAAGPPAPVEPAGRDLLRELRLALAKCTPAQRAWLRQLPKHNFQLWGKAREELGLSKHTVWKWLRRDCVKRVRELQDEIAVEDLNISTRRVLTEYSRIAFADLRGLFNDDGTLKTPDQWDDDVAAAVESIDTQETRLRGDDGKYIDEFELVRKVRTHSKLSALEFLASFKKIAGAKRLEVTGANGEPLAGPVPVIQFVERADTD